MKQYMESDLALAAPRVATRTIAEARLLPPRRLASSFYHRGDPARRRRTACGGRLPEPSRQAVASAGSCALATGGRTLPSAEHPRAAAVHGRASGTCSTAARLERAHGGCRPAARMGPPPVSVPFRLEESPFIARLRPPAPATSVCRHCRAVTPTRAARPPPELDLRGRARSWLDDVRARAARLVVLTGGDPAKRARPGRAGPPRQAHRTVHGADAASGDAGWSRVAVLARSPADVGPGQRLACEPDGTVARVARRLWRRQATRTLVILRDARELGLARRVGGTSAGDRPRTSPTSQAISSRHPVAGPTSSLWSVSSRSRPAAASSCACSRPTWPRPCCSASLRSRRRRAVTRTSRRPPPRLHFRHACRWQRHVRRTNAVGTARRDRRRAARRERRTGRALRLRTAARSTRAASCRSRAGTSEATRSRTSTASHATLHEAAATPTAPAAGSAR